jgi:hypothetical protein
MMQYATAETCHVSMLRIRVRDPGMAEWYRQCCINSTFRRISIFPTLRGHLLLAIASCGAPRGVGVSGYSVCPWAYK